MEVRLNQLLTLHLQCQQVQSLPFLRGHDWGDNMEKTSCIVYCQFSQHAKTYNPSGEEIETRYITVDGSSIINLGFIVPYGGYISFTPPSGYTAHIKSLYSSSNTLLVIDSGVTRKLNIVGDVIIVLTSSSTLSENVAPT